MIRVLLQLRDTLFLDNIVWIDGSKAAICSGVDGCDWVAEFVTTTSTTSGKLTRALDKDPGLC